MFFLGSVIYYPKTNYIGVSRWQRDPKHWRGQTKPRPSRYPLMNPKCHCIRPIPSATGTSGSLYVMHCRCAGKLDGFSVCLHAESDKTSPLYSSRQSVYIITYIHIYTYMHISMFICIHLHMCICMCIYIYTHAYVPT